MSAKATDGGLHLTVPSPGSIPQLDLLLLEAHESIERLRQAHAAMAAIRERIEAESSWLAGVFAAAAVDRGNVK